MRLSYCTTVSQVSGALWLCNNQHRLGTACSLQRAPRLERARVGLGGGGGGAGRWFHTQTLIQLLLLWRSRVREVRRRKRSGTQAGGHWFELVGAAAPAVSARRRRAAEQLHRSGARRIAPVRASGGRTGRPYTWQQLNLLPRTRNSG
jgi:hypothetical protein